MIRMHPKIKTSVWDGQTSKMMISIMSACDGLDYIKHTKLGGSDRIAVITLVVIAFDGDMFGQCRS